MVIYDHSLHKIEIGSGRELGATLSLGRAPPAPHYASFISSPLYIYSDFSFTRIFHLHAKAVYALTRASSDLLFYKTDKKVFRGVIYLSPIFFRDELTDVSRCSENVTHHFKHALPWRCHGTFKLRT
jgi:hypothetical protein